MLQFVAACGDCFIVTIDLSDAAKPGLEHELLQMLWGRLLEEGLVDTPNLPQVQKCLVSDPTRTLSMDVGGLVHSGDVVVGRLTPNAMSVRTHDPLHAPSNASGGETSM